MSHLPHVIFSRIDHRRSHCPGCECQQCTPTLYDIAMGDPELAAELFAASKGGNVPGITEDHRHDLLLVCQEDRIGEASMSDKSLTVDDDMGYCTSVTMIYAPTCLALRRKVRELNPGHIPIYSPYDCTGLICDQRCKFLKVYRTYVGQYVGIIEILTTRDV